jgi:hypothetical protein
MPDIFIEKTKAKIVSLPKKKSKRRKKDKSERWKVVFVEDSDSEREIVR